MYNECTLLILMLTATLHDTAQRNTRSSEHADRLESVRRSNNKALIHKSAFSGDTFELIIGNAAIEKRVDPNGKITFTNIRSGNIRIKKLGRNLYENAASKVSITAVSGKRKKALFTGFIPVMQSGVDLKMPFKGNVLVQITDAH